MTSLPNLAVLAPRAAAAPAQTTGAESPNEGGAFAAALDLAREPAGEAGAPDACTAGTPDSGEHDDAADTSSAELGALLPGWPLAAWPGTAPAGACARVTAAAMRSAGHAAPPLEALAPAQGLEAAIGERLERGADHERTRSRNALPAPDQAASPVARTPTATAATSATAQAAEAAAAAPTAAKIDLSAIAAPNTLGAPWSNPGAVPGVSAYGGVASAAGAAPPPFEARLAAAIDSAAFAPALANQVTWLAGEGVQQARIHLNPAEMGPLSVKIVLDGSQARIDFSADLAATRSAIEASLPTLAAALNDQGLTLAGGGVFDGQARHGTGRERSAPLPNAHTGAAGASHMPDGAAEAQPLRAARGLVDLVA